MKTFRKRVFSFAICLALLLGAAAPVYAADTAEGPPPALEGFLYDAGDFALRAAANGLAALVPPAERLPLNYASPDFYPGMERFIDKPEGVKQWSLGYAKKTLIPDGYFDKGGKYIGGGDVYMGGGIEIAERKNPTGLSDDQAVRVTALSDGSGRGAVVLASIDGYALTSTDVRAIRALLRDYAKEKNIVSINIGVLHQHSCIDILGMNGPIPLALAVNPLANLTGLFRPVSGKNTAFMENLHQVTAAAVKEAVAGMKRGSLYYGAVDAGKYIRDKRPPQVIDPLLHRFRFTPDDGSRETWLVNYAAHCVGLGADTREVSSDYPHYMEAEIAKKANFQMIQGAQLAITVDTADLGVPGATRLQNVESYGRGLGKLLAGSKKETRVEPILNVRHKEFRAPIDNPLHLLLFRYGMIKAEGARRWPLGPAMDLVTETGYMEIGKDLAVMFAPGEMEPCLAFGGGLTAEEAWSGKAFEFTPMDTQVRGGRKLLVFGIMNDHSGYYLLPNDIQSFVLFGNEEVNTASTKGSELLLKAFGEIMESLR
ncbi:MAG: hypothetical protein LBB75_05775 [Oscillospiraceae bacterium]|jgi:hypothetical protein|nr:hypothetical protein [Oscillospiraceae bacterium]